MSWKTYEVPVEFLSTAYYRVKAQSRSHAADLVESKAHELEPHDIREGDADLRYDRIYEVEA